MKTCLLKNKIYCSITDRNWLLIYFYLTQYGIFKTTSSTDSEEVSLTNLQERYNFRKTKQQSVIITPKDSIVGISGIPLSKK